MDEMKLRGYVTPEDFSGSDTEKLQQALDTAAEKDIGKVIVTGSYTVEKTLLVPEGMHLVFEDAAVTTGGDFPLLQNTALTGKQPAWSFEEKYFYLSGKNARLTGDLLFFNADKIVVEDLAIAGRLIFDFARNLRVERVAFLGEGGISLCRGCNNAIIQHITGESTLLTLDTAETPRPYAVGKEPDIHEIICRDVTAKTGKAAVTLDASEAETIFNIQIDHIQADAVAVEISGKAGSLPREIYFNIVAEALSSPAVSHSDTKHCILE